MYIVRTHVDPFSSDELPILLFKNKPTREQVWEELKKEYFYEVNKEDAPNSEDWDWNFQVYPAQLIDNGDPS